MKVLITGDKGFVGTETVKLLNSKVDPTPIGLTSTSRTEKPRFEVIGYDIMDGRDIRDYKQLEEVVSAIRPDRILHLAAIARFDEADKDPKRCHETNVIGTMNVVQVARKFHIPLVYASTGSAYMPIKLVPPITEEFPTMGNSVYGCSKALGEKYVQEHNPHIILRYAHLYGKEKRYHGLIGGFMARIEHDLEPVLYGGKQSNDFTYIKDVAEANYLALTAPWDKYNQTYNVGTGEELTAEQAGKIICDAAGYKGEIQIKPQRSVDPDRFVFDTSKAERMLGFKAQYSFAEGLQDMFNDSPTD